MLYADSKRSTGKKTKNSISGVNSKWFIKFRKGICDNGTRIRPIITRSTVYGKLIFFENKNVKLEIVSKKRSDSVELRNETSILLVKKLKLRNYISKKIKSSFC